MEIRTLINVKAQSKVCLLLGFVVVAKLFLVTSYVFVRFSLQNLVSIRDGQANSIPTITIPSNISCSKLFDGDDNEVKRIPSGLRGHVSLEDDTYQSKLLVNQTKHCDTFCKDRLYVNTSLSQEENDFPIAYSMLVFKDPLQVENLLRAIYRPQNFYCLHVDARAMGYYKDAIQGLASCFPNVFVPSNCTEVRWGQWGVLEAEMVCMRELIKRKKHWKYFINLTGQEFPLRTNLEIVRILKTLNGSNDIKYEYCPQCSRRWENSHHGNKVVGKKEPAPHNIKVHKGSTHVLLSREFVDFILTDPKIQDFYEWLKDTTFPEETFLPTIQFNPHLNAPGTYTDDAAKSPTSAHIARYKYWTFDRDAKRACQGIKTHHICIFSAKDIPRLKDASELFVNKLHSDYEPIVRHCLEERLFLRTREEFVNGERVHLNMTTYEMLPIVKNHQ